MQNTSRNERNVTPEEIAKALSSTKSTSFEAASDKKSTVMEYNAPNGRMFILEVRAVSGGRGFGGKEDDRLDYLHYLRELRLSPTKKLVQAGQSDNVISLIRHDKFVNIMSDPNMYRSRLEEIGVDSRSLKYMPIEPRSENCYNVAYADFASVCEKIAEAINNNEWFDSYCYTKAV